jgi:magnesium transporter
LQAIASQYQLDYFQIMDSLEVGHLPKYEHQANYNFLILRAYTAQPTDRVNSIADSSNKIAFFYKEDQLITIHRTPFAFLAALKRDYPSCESLLLAMIKSMVDSYNEPSKLLSDQIDAMEQTIFLRDYKKISLTELYFQKTKTRITKKLLQITQQVLHQVEVSAAHKSALADIHDSMLNLVLVYEEVLDNAHTILNTYLSINAQKSNDVMKVLTVFSAFFLPLTFIVGIYGMNFENMPELKWANGYYLVLGFMLLITLGIYRWFKKKGFL